MAGTEGQQGCTGVIAEVALVPFRKGQCPFTKRVIKGIGAKTIDEAVAETEARKQRAEGELQEAIALEQTEEIRAKEARAEFDKIHVEIAGKIEEEMAAAVDLSTMKAQRRVLASHTYTLRGDVFEAQKKVALLEILSANRAKMKVISDQAKAAAKAAEEAARQISEEKKLQRHAIEATRRAWADMDKKASKRAARVVACELRVEEAPSKRPMLQRKAIPSPTVSQNITHLCRDSEHEECAPTIVQITQHSEHQVEETTCTLFEDAQLPCSL